MSDGANLGVSAGRALKTILGDEPQPSEQERATLDELEARIRTRSLPGDGTRPWDGGNDDAYSVAAESIAHAFLVLADERPELLTERRFYDGTEMDANGEENAQWWHQHMTGKEREPTEAIWAAFKERWPNGDDWIGGATGFMVGWAFNAVRTIKHIEPAQNPAIVEMGS